MKCLKVMSTGKFNWSETYEKNSWGVFLSVFHFEFSQIWFCFYIYDVSLTVLSFLVILSRYTEKTTEKTMFHSIHPAFITRESQCIPEAIEVSIWSADSLYYWPFCWRLLIAKINDGGMTQLWNLTDLTDHVIKLMMIVIVLILYWWLFQ